MIQPGLDVNDSWLRHLTKKCKKNPRRKKELERAEQKAYEEEVSKHFNPEDTIPKNVVLPN